MRLQCSLPDNVVCAKTSNAFKTLIDKFWSNQEFNLIGEQVSGTGRSLEI